jgi:hypothetical protein
MNSKFSNNNIKRKLVPPSLILNVPVQTDYLYLYCILGKYVCDGNAGSSGGDQYRYAALPIRENEVESGSEC